MKSGNWQLLLFQNMSEATYMNEKALSEQEWVYNYLQSRKEPLPLVIGTRGTWGINGKRAIILIAFTIPDIMVFREMHNVANNPIRKMKYKNIFYFAVSIVDKKQVEYLIDYWKENCQSLHSEI